jgi:hypothetical protein
MPPVRHSARLIEPIRPVTSPLLGGKSSNDGTVEHVFYPVFPPDRNAGDVIEWLSQKVQH